MSPSIIGLAGRKGSGKSTLAKMIPGPKIILPIAEPIKMGLAAMGVPSELLYSPDLKESPQELLCGKSARHAMVTLGTEWGRDQMGPDFWVNMWAVKIKEYHYPFTVVCDDVRFSNEVAMIRDLGGFVIAIEKDRPEVKRRWWQRKHRSESLNFADLQIPVIRNDGTPEQLLGKFSAIYSRGT